MTSQPSLLDALNEQTATAQLEELHARGEQPGVVNRQRYLETWRQVHGNWDMYRRSVDECPWLPWRVGTTAPGGYAGTQGLIESQELGCYPTVLMVDCRPGVGARSDRPGRPPFTLIWRGACLGCDWEGEIRDSENAAVEDAHDHIYPDWWRSLPTIERPAYDLTNARRAKLRAEVVALYEATTPGCTTHPAGCPVWTRRQPGRGRHHHGGLLGGFDLGRVEGES